MTEYMVADSYKGFELIGEPYYNKAGKMVSIARCKCDRCVKGVYVTRVENGHPVPHPAYEGVCLKCGGTGFIQKEIRLYTKAEYDTMQKNNERNRQRKAEAAEAKRLSGFDAKRARWFSENGFDAEGNTYIYIKEDSYQKKEELKAAGYKYNPILKWHGPAAAGFDNDTEIHNVTEFYEPTAWGTYNLFPNAKDKIEQIISANRPVSTSEWVGEVGKKITNIPVTIVEIRSFNGRYGHSNVLKFRSKEGNIFTWFTASKSIDFYEDDECILAGTVKKHDEYKGEKTTVMTRCTLA